MFVVPALYLRFDSRRAGAEGGPTQRLDERLIV